MGGQACEGECRMKLKTKKKRENERKRRQKMSGVGMTKTKRDGKLLFVPLCFDLVGWQKKRKNCLGVNGVELNTQNK